LRGRAESMMAQRFATGFVLRRPGALCIVDLRFGPFTER
jgi:hypothetical protein